MHSASAKPFSKPDLFSSAINIVLRSLEKNPKTLWIRSSSLSPEAKGSTLPIGRRKLDRPSTFGVGGTVERAPRLSWGGSGSPDTPGDWFPIRRRGMWRTLPLFLPDTAACLWSMGHLWPGLLIYKMTELTVSNGSVCTATTSPENRPALQYSE